MNPERTALAAALTHPDSSVRLRAAMAAGTSPDPDLLESLVDRCATEPDFFVRDMLTWAITRLPADVTVPRLLVELRSPVNQARSQSLHTLSKIGDSRAWPAIERGHLHDPDDEIARTAWRAAAALAPHSEKAALATELATELGCRDPASRRSLSRALVELDDIAEPVLAAAASHDDPQVRAHAASTLKMLEEARADR